MTNSAPPLSRLAVRLVLIVLVAVLAVVSARDAALAHWRAIKAADPPALFAGDARIILRQAETTDNSPLRPADLARLNRAADEVLASSPLSPTALHYAGLYSASRGEKPGIAAVELAERLSRRKLWNQLQLLQLAARNTDARSTLRHMDRALVVYPQSGEFLYRGLREMLFVPGVRHELAQYAHQPWFPGFARSTFDDGGTAGETMAAVAEAGAKVPASERNKLARAAMAQAATRGSYGEALLLAEYLDPQARTPLSELGFVPATMVPEFGKLGWQLSNDSVAQAFAAADGSVDLALAPERSHMIAERTTLLPPGSYSFVQVLAYDADAPAAALSWELRCAMSGEARLWQQDFPTDAGTKRYRAEIVIPPGCLGQRWVLTAAAGLTQDQALAKIVSISLARD